MEVSNVANAVITMSSMFNCSLEIAWEKYTHPAITEKFTFEEVKKHIDEKIELGKKMTEF